nr:MAG TPA: Nuclear receptor-interacting protein 1 repression 1 [Caudoviricetes sp.]
MKTCAAFIPMAGSPAASPKSSTACTASTSRPQK